MRAKPLLLPLVLSASLLATARAAAPPPVLQAETPIQVSVEPKRFDLVAVDSPMRRNERGRRSFRAFERETKVQVEFDEDVGAPEMIG